jgi:hypothetical protein
MAALGMASPYYFLPSICSQYFSGNQARVYQQHGAYNLLSAVQGLVMAGLVGHSAQGYWSCHDCSTLSLEIYIPNSEEDRYRSVLSLLVQNAAAINITVTTVTVSTHTLIGTLKIQGARSPLPLFKGIHSYRSTFGVV